MIAVGCLWICLWQLHASFTYFGDLLRCPHKRIVTITKERVHRKKHHASSIHTIPSKISPLFTFTFARRRILGPLYVYSLFARWQQLATNKLITIHSPDGSMTDEQAIIKLGLKTGAGSSHGKSVQAPIRFVIQPVIFLIPFITV